MAVRAKHTVTAVGPNDPTKQVSVTAWNADQPINQDLAGMLGSLAPSAQTIELTPAQVKTLLALAAVASSGSVTDLTQASAGVLGAIGAGAVTVLSGAQARSLLSLAAIAASGSASDLIAGTLPTAQMPALTGDVTTPGGSLATTLATVNVSGAGTFGSVTAVPVITADAKGRLTAISTVTKREQLTGNRTYFVRSDGNDSNNGLTNLAGGAFLTIQKAWNVILTLDLNGFTVTIQLGNTATFTGGLSATSPPVGGNVIIQGDTGTPANTIISTTSASAIQVSCPATVTVQFLELRTTTSGSALFSQGPGARINIGAGVRFGATADYHCRAISGGYIQNSGNNYSITGGAQIHYSANISGIIELSGSTVTVTGTPAFSASFCQGETGSAISAFSMTFSGAATGTRYSATMNSVIQTYGGGATLFPGSVAGTTATGGQYA